MDTANSILARYRDRLATRRVVCRAGLTDDMPALLGEFLPPGRWLLVADENTWSAQGMALSRALVRAGMVHEQVILRPVAGRTELVCESSLVEQVADRLGGRGGADGQGQGFAAAVAVGAGTICDAVKLAAQAARTPSAAVATAPSMNGYPSIIAAVLREGVKRTDPASPPILVLADLDVLCAAPQRMIAAGLADLLAKPVSTADWTLANELLGDPVSADGLAVVEQSARLAEALSPALPLRRPETIARLFEALFVSGLAMAVSGASSPASGGEHLISHYLDMTALCPRPERKLADRAGDSDARLARHDLHGLQVGVATLVTAELYRRLLDWDAGQLDIPARVRRQPPWPQVELELGSHFGPTLAPAVIPQARQLHAESEALADRLGRLRAAFPTLRLRLADRLRGAGRIEAELAACGAATRFSQIGVDRSRALDAVRFARFVRARYTILHLLADLGLLDDWAGSVVGAWC